MTVLTLSCPMIKFVGRVKIPPYQDGILLAIVSCVEPNTNEEYGEENQLRNGLYD